MNNKFLSLVISFFVFNFCMVASQPVTAQVKDPNPQKTLRTITAHAIDSFFLRNCTKDEVFSTNKPKDMAGNDMGYDVWQFKGFTSELRPIKLTSAEKLNGYDFKGEIIINAKDFRQYHFCGKNGSASETSCNAWQEWKPFESPLSISIVKKTGEWIITGVNKKQWVYLPAGVNAPKCETILKIK